MIAKRTLAVSALLLSLLLPRLRADEPTPASHVAGFVSAYASVTELDQPAPGELKVIAAVADFSLMGEHLSRSCPSIDGKIHAAGNELQFACSGVAVTVTHLVRSSAETSTKHSANTYEQWCTLFPATGLEKIDADTDGDGIANLMEYALGLDPTIADSRQATRAVSETADGKRLIGISYPRKIGREDVIVEVQCSPDLSPASWTRVGVSDQVVSTSGEFEMRMGMVPAGEPRQFLRLKVSRIEQD